MKKNKHLRLLAIIAVVLVLLSVLSGCQGRKKFDSPEAMVSEMTGTYSGSGEHSGERVVIDGNNVIKFNIEDIFPEITDDTFIWENFPNENWESFDINALLGKPYIKITAEPISTNIKKSTISGMWINKDGELFIRKDYSLKKTSSESIYPTAEMQEKFEKYRTYLQEYERSSIIAEAESNFVKEKEALQAALSSATSSNSTSKKSTASAETIANCAFESLMDHIKYPRTAKLEGFSTSPQYDSYGRVCTLITITTQNGFGNYITEDVYVVLQSCSSSGSYTYTPGGMHYTKNEDSFDIVLFTNGWDKDPSTDNTKEASYNEAIQLIKNEEYRLAANKLDALGDYKSSVKLTEACVSISVAETYKNAVDLFAEGKYTEASKELASFLEKNNGYLRAERVITLCNAASSNTSNSSDSSDSSVTGSPLSETIVSSKVWMIEFNADGVEGVFHYAFQEDGTCYVVLSDGLEPWSGGKGTYQINGNSIDFSIVIDGARFDYGYTYDPQTQTLTHTFGTPVFAGLAATGDKYLLVEDDANDVAKIRDMATDFAGAESSSASGNGGFSNNNSSSGNGNSTNHTPTPGGNTSSGSSNPGAGTQTVCEHSYNEATCTKPKTCTKCGATTGSTIDHTWKYTSCTTEKACSVCNAPLIGSTPGHQWKNATCTNPETCGVCNETQGQALGHDVRLTKCIRCSYTDYSAIAKSYSVSSAYDSKTGEDLTVTDVSVNKSGVLSFTFNGTRYSITIKEKTYDSMTYFTCYQDGKKLSNAECRIGDASYYNMLHFEWDGIDGHRLYFCTKKQ